MINVMADAPSWTDTGGFWIALAGAAFGVGGFGVAIWSARSGQRSAKAAENAVADSRRAADAAEAAARAAEMSADADQRLAQLETAGLHDSYAPRFEGRWRFEKSQLQDGSRHLVYQFKLDRDYRIEAIAWTMNRAGQIGPPTVTPPSAPGGDWTIWVEQWSRDRTHSEVRELELRFWSPRAVPGRAKPWECRCGGPGPDDSAPHWDAIVKVTPPPPVKVVVPS